MSIPRYREIEHTADVGVEVYGDTLEELFQNAGYAFFDTIADVTTVTSTLSRTVSVTGDDIESLFFNWLRELLYLCSVHQEIYAEFEIHSLQPTHLDASVKGELLDLEKHNFQTEIKAVTYHQFAVANERGIWKARVIFDI